MSLTSKIEEKRKAKIKARKRENAKNVGVGALVGTIAGALGGVLLAPKSGKETREDIKDASVKASEGIKDGYRVLGDKVLVKREELKRILESKTAAKFEGIVDKVEEEEVTE